MILSISGLLGFSDLLVRPQIRFLLLISRQGKVRLTKWYSPYAQKDKARIMREVTSMVLSRPPKMCNFIEWKDQKIVYKRSDAVVSRPNGQTLSAL